MVKQAICNRCLKKCILEIEKDGTLLEVSGNQCDEGIKYAEEEIKNTSGILTTLVRIKGANCNVVSVKSSKPIDKELWVDCSRALSRIYVGAPISIGDIVCKNILNTGVDIICSKNVDKMR